MVRISTWIIALFVILPIGNRIFYFTLKKYFFLRIHILNTLLFNFTFNSMVLLVHFSFFASFIHSNRWNFIFSFYTSASFPSFTCY
ncbi:hypothetical protein CW304_25440 [Bacillus sp. UFRGS-B20]|nr:hypothetical protein CW304_25440 [Bacillus sp. UFRGS-B20]